MASIVYSVFVLCGRWSLMSFRIAVAAVQTITLLFLVQHHSGMSAFINSAGPLINEAARNARAGAQVKPAMPLTNGGAIEGKRVKLFAMNVDRDAHELYEASNGRSYGIDKQPQAYDAEALIWRFMFWGPFASEQEFAKTYREQCAIPNMAPLVIFDKKLQRKVGVACYSNNDPGALRIELGGIWLSPEVQGTSVNTEAIYLLLQFAFDGLGYQRVEWKCDARNLRSREAALKLGFKLDGIFPKHMIIKGRHRDTAWYGMVIDDWPAVKLHLLAKLAKMERLSSRQKSLGIASKL